MDLAGQVMARPEDKSAPRAFVIVDNGSDHRRKADADRLRTAYPNTIMIHPPRARLVAEPDRDFLLDHPEESRIPE
jgi:hypothetical protein